MSIASRARGRKRAAARPAHRRAVGWTGALALLAANLAFIGGAPVPSQAAVSPSEQFPTAVAGSALEVGNSVGLTYGTTGVSATYRLDQIPNPLANDDCRQQGAYARPDFTPFPATPNGFDNALQFLEPDPPTGSGFVRECVPGPPNVPAAEVIGTLTLSKPVVQPVLHAINMDGSRVTIGGDVTTLTPVVPPNSPMDFALTTLNSLTTTPAARGCSNIVSNVDGACGSFRMSGANPIGVVTFDNVYGDPAIGHDDVWFWTVSFPTAPLTAVFNPPSIVAGATTNLVFTITNPNAVTLFPLDFTGLLPAGVTIAGPGSATNGNCGVPAVTANGGAPLTVGAGGVQATNISVAAGAVCTITVTVTASAPGVFSLTSGMASSGVGNVIPQLAASLTVTGPAGGSAGSGTGSGNINISINNSNSNTNVNKNKNSNKNSNASKSSHAKKHKKPHHKPSHHKKTDHKKVDHKKADHKKSCGCKKES